jgi:hypothetical protein
MKLIRPNLFTPVIATDTTYSDSYILMLRTVCYLFFVLFYNFHLSQLMLSLYKEIYCETDISSNDCSFDHSFLFVCGSLSRHNLLNRFFFGSRNQCRIKNKETAVRWTNARISLYRYLIINNNASFLVYHSLFVCLFVFNLLNRFFFGSRKTGIFFAVIRIWHRFAKFSYKIKTVSQYISLYRDNINWDKWKL